MDISKVLIIISSIIAFISYGVFINSIVKGKAKPHRTTRFVVLLVNTIQTLTLLSTGNTVATWLTGIFAINNLAIFLLSIKYGVGGWSKIDISCLILALIGAILWKITNNPILGLFLAVFADFISFIPTIIKAYNSPQTEEWRFYGLDWFSALLNLLATKAWNLPSILFPLYILFIDGVLVTLILFSRKSPHLK